ncbi:MAG TPA: zf-HC2 domain-containing protein [Burkholderiales bacterium]|nr:zf-HC2 domain-containing protein [Burkholderiales bacterium]
MMLTCKEAGRSISERLDRKLSLPQRAALRLHLALCDACARINAQFRFLRRAASRYPGPERDTGES